MPCKQITVIKVLNRSLSCACKELYKVLLHLILKLQSHIIPIIEDKHVIISIWNDLSWVRVNCVSDIMPVIKKLIMRTNFNVVYQENSNQLLTGTV